MQGLPQLLQAVQHLALRHRFTVQPGLDGGAGVAQQVAQRAQHRAVGFMGLTRTLAQGLVTVGHGQLFNQMHEVGEIEIGGLPAAQQHDLGGHRGGHIGIAVAVTAHPRDEGDR